MAEEIQIHECNGDRHTEVPQITNIIDQMDTVMVCEKREVDPGIPSDNKEQSGICLEDKNDFLEINKENTEEEHQAKQDIAAEQESGLLTSRNAFSGEHSNGEDIQTTLEVEGDNVPAHKTPGKEEINEQEKDQEESKAEAQDIYMYEQIKPLSETREEDIQTETEEENTSIETDNDNGQGSCDEQENGPGPIFPVSPSGGHFESNSEQEVPGNRPDISRNSYSRYDTVSYRKIRRGNTKQRIDEFESMMN
ncbi:ermin [Mantella aurantiaca]